MSEKYKECPYCGAVQSYKVKKCSECHKELTVEKKSFFEWFSDADKRKTFLERSKRTFIKASTVLITILSIFIALNIIPFKVAIDYATRNPEYKEPRAYMASALLINSMYIYPLTRAFKWDSLITKPFYFVRDKLFDIGYSKFPIDEGEKEFWWYSVKFKEYEECVSANIIKWGTNPNPGMYLNSKRDKFVKWDKELYKHIDTLASAKITDKTDKSLAKQKLVEFVLLARRYQDSNTILNFKFEKDRRSKFGDPYKTEISLPYSEGKKYEHIYDTYINLLKYSKIHEKESHNYYYRKQIHWMHGHIFVFYLAQEILESKLYNNKLDCNDRFVKIFADQHKIIRDFYLPNRINEKANHSLIMDAGAVALTVDPIIAYKCRNNPAMKDYIQYTLVQYLDDLSLIRKSNNEQIKTINDVKNNIRKSYIEFKKYDKLRQLDYVGIK